MAAYLKLNLTESKVDPKTNTSKVKADLYYYGNGVSWNQLRPSGSIIVNGSSVSFRHNFSKSKGAQWLGSHEVTVKHDSNGKKTVSASASFATGVSIGTLTTSASKKLTDIAVAPPTPTESDYKDFPSGLGWTLNGGKGRSYAKGGTAALLGAYATAKSYGSGSGWHGLSLSRAVSATDWQFVYKQILAAYNSNQRGLFAALVLDANSKVVAGVEIVKSAAGNYGTLNYIANGSIIKTKSVDLSINNAYFGATDSAVKTTSIIKNGEKLFFDVAGMQETFTLDLADAKSVEFWTCGYGSNAALTYNGLASAKFVKNSSEWVDIPNTFTAGDELIIDTKTATVTLNGLERPDLGRLGNDWEQLVLSKGANQIGVAHSDFGDPTVTMLYREVFA